MTTKTPSIFKKILISSIFFFSLSFSSEAGLRTPFTGTEPSVQLLEKQEKQTNNQIALSQQVGQQADGQTTEPAIKAATESQLFKTNFGEISSQEKPVKNVKMNDPIIKLKLKGLVTQVEKLKIFHNEDIQEQVQLAEDITGFMLREFMKRTRKSKKLADYTLTETIKKYTSQVKKLKENHQQEFDQYSNQTKTLIRKDQAKIEQIEKAKGELTKQLKDANEKLANKIVMHEEELQEVDYRSVKQLQYVRHLRLQRKIVAAGFMVLFILYFLKNWGADLKVLKERMPKIYNFFSESYEFLGKRFNKSFA